MNHRDKPKVRDDHCPARADLVVIGGGGGGLAAAVAALELGLTNIVVLEKRGTVGGNTALAAGFFAAESPTQKRNMIDCTREGAFRTMVDWAHWSRVDPEILRAFVDRSGDTAAWLGQKGVTLTIRTQYPGQSRHWHCPEGGGKTVIAALLRQCADAGIAVITRSHVLRILRDSNGAVCGVSVGGDGPNQRIIACHATIIATGGITGNKDLLAKFCPGHVATIGALGVKNEGDGLQLASDAEAAIARTIPLVTEGPTPDVDHWRFPAGLAGLMREPSALWVNRTGRRFCDESAAYVPFVSGRSIAMQPEAKMFSLLDDALVQHVEESGLVLGMTPGEREELAGQPLSGLRERLAQIAADSTAQPFRVAGSWADLAGFVGVDSETLQATVARYNTGCDHGVDRELGKPVRYLRPLDTPPFYAVRGRPFYVDTAGGIRTTGRMQVLDQQLAPIPGLFAAGVIVDGHQSDSYCGELCGSLFGFALNSGRIAGESAAISIMGSHV
ncbi:MAG: FAD-dependent oxidoreductase [Armatimonadetes bacterium]|nr:FAD-dependent oxidoreductase [Armatimonadota bacterium]